MLKQDLIYKQKDCLGLDVGAGSVKIVQLKKKKKLTKLIGYESKKIPENIILEGIISEPKNLAEIIKVMMESVKEGKFTAEKVIASIPDTNVFTRVLEFPEISDKELKEAVYWEADQSIPMATTDLIVDWQMLGPSATKKGANDVLIVAAPRSIVNSYMQLFDMLGFQPEAIEMSMASSIRSLVSNKEKDEVMMVADIGAKSTNLGVYDHTLRLSDTVSIGGDMFTGNIMSALKFEQKKAESLKLEKGLKDEKIKKALESSLKTLKDEMEKVIRYHDDRFGENRQTSKLILCGGSSNLIGLTEYLADNLKIEVRVGNPWVNIDTYPLKPVPKKESSAYANALGLSLRGMEGGRV